jgi:hypothetical protein
MAAATALPEEAAITVFLGSQNCTAGLGMAFDELCRRDAQIPRKTKDFVGADADCLVATATIAGVTGV